MRQQGWFLIGKSFMRDSSWELSGRESDSLLMFSLVVFSLDFNFLITPAVSTVRDCLAFAVLCELLSWHLLALRINQPCAEGCICAGQH